MNVRSVNRLASKGRSKRSAGGGSGGATAARSDSTTGRRGRPLVDDKRRRILDAGLRTFAERGYHGTTVPEVADAAAVGTGTLYRYFENKEALVNEVYRDAKERLRAALLGSAGKASTTAASDLLSTVDLYRLDAAEQWFAELWRRLGTFARAEPDAFRFLEMQDHVPYLDDRSKQVELSVLAPLWIAGKRLRGSAAGAAVDVLIALLWGAFVGIIKAGRLGYLVVDDKTLAQAGAACWRLIAPGTAAHATDLAATDLAATGLTLPSVLTHQRPLTARATAHREPAPRTTPNRSIARRVPAPRNPAPTRSTARRAPAPRNPTPKGK